MPLMLALLILLASAWTPAAEAAASLRCPGTDASVLERRGRASLVRGDWLAATRALACAARQSDDPELAERSTRTAFDHGLHDWAQAAAERWLELDPSSEVARRHLAITLLRRHDISAAVRQFALLLDSAYADRARGHSALLAILAGENNVTGAARLHEQLASNDAGLPEAHYAQSVLWQRADHGSRALAAARRALELRPGWRQAQLAEVRALTTLGRKAEALAQIEALAADDDPFTRLTQAWLMSSEGQDEQAAAIFGGLRRQGVALTESLEGLGALALDQHRYDDANRLFTEMAQHARGSDGVMWYLGRVAEARDETELAIRYLERVTTGSRAEAAQLRAYRLAREAGFTERAELQLAEFVAANPMSARTIVTGLASQMAGSGATGDGIRLLNAALKRHPDDDLRLARGYLLERADRVSEALVDMRAVLANRPGDPSVMNALGYTLVDRTSARTEGYELIARALADKPDNYAIIDSMGWALLQLGRPAEGLTYLEDAWQRSRDPEVAAHLGEALWQLGRADEGQKLWQESLAEYPDSEPLKRAISRRGS